MGINNPQQCSSKRIQWIDAAKGVAIVLVLIAHSSFWEFSTSHEGIKAIPFIRKCFMVAIASYMPLFYFLSGYTYKQKPNALKLRFDRLIKPYMLWGALSILLVWIMAGTGNQCSREYASPALGLLYSRHSLFSTEAENNVLLLPENATPLWFLTSLFTSFICFLLLLRFRRYQSYIIIAYLFIALLLSFSPILLPWSMDTAPLGALFIYSGFVCQKKLFFSGLNRRKLLGAVFLFALYAAAVWYNEGINMSIREYGAHPFLSPFLFVFIGISGSILSCVACMVIEKIHLSSGFAYLGRISLTILCCHAIVYHILNTLLPKGTDFFWSMLDHAHAFFIIQILAALLVSIFICEIKEKLAFNKR